MKIKVKAINDDCKFEINSKGDWIDLKCAEDYTFKGPYAHREHQVNNVKMRDVVFDEKMVELGIAMQLPKGYEAIVKERSSTLKKLGLVKATSGVIDYTYRGNEDTWKFYCYALRPATLKKGTRLCQFRIQLSQFATPWQKIKWLFSNRPTFEWVDSLEGENRGGHGSTDVNTNA